MYGRRKSLAHTLLGAVDLAIDFATLGEYGLEVVPADGPCRERSGPEAGWEALAGPAAGRSRRAPRRGHAPKRRTPRHHREARRARAGGRLAA